MAKGYSMWWSQKLGATTGLALLLCGAAVPMLAAQEASTAASSATSVSATSVSASSATVPAISGQSPLDFAKVHHPELAVLLEQLRKSAPKEYKAAMTDLERAQQRLARSQEKSPDRFPLELAEWKVTSRIRLILARMTMSGDEVLEGELRAALVERHAVRQQLLQEEQTRLAERLKKIELQLGTSPDEVEAQIAREMTGLLQSVHSTSTVKKNETRKALKSLDGKNTPGKIPADDRSRASAGKAAANAPDVSTSREADVVRSKSKSKSAGGTESRPEKSRTGN